MSAAARFRRAWPDALPIAEGESASLELVRLLFHGDTMEREAKERLREDWPRHCAHDRGGLAERLAVLRELAPCEK